MVNISSTFGFVAMSTTALTVDKVAVNGFVQSSARHVSSRQSPFHMSLSLPDDKQNHWDESQSIPRADDSSGPSGADGLESLESSSADIEYKFTTDQYIGHDGAFPLPDDLEVPEMRQLRWEREALVKTKFASDDEVFDLRSSIAELRRELIELRGQVDDETLVGSDMMAAERRVAQLEKELLSLNARDAEFMYAVSLELKEKALAVGDDDLVEKYTTQMEDARLCIPQLNMHGLWVGKYGEHGYEMINVTYSGDTLIATKVTGDRNVPKGEVSFTVDCSPRSSSKSRRRKDETSAILEPIELNPKAARQWGKRYLPRHLGKGQVASENFSNAQWMEGQLILVGRFFSFAWVPIGHQVFFGRPSSELTLKMLKEAQEEEMRRDHVVVMRDVAETMWDETYWEEREMSGDNYYSSGAEESCFE